MGWWVQGPELYLSHLGERIPKESSEPSVELKFIPSSFLCLSVLFTSSFLTEWDLHPSLYMRGPHWPLSFLGYFPFCGWSRAVPTPLCDSPPLYACVTLSPRPSELLHLRGFISHSLMWWEFPTKAHTVAPVRSFPVSWLHCPPGHGPHTLIRTLTCTYTHSLNSCLFQTYFWWKNRTRILLK